MDHRIGITRGDLASMQIAWPFPRRLSISKGMEMHALERALEMSSQGYTYTQ